MVRPSRRTLVAGAAWSLPAVVVASPAPAFAASNCRIERSGFVSLNSTFSQRGLDGDARITLESLGTDALRFVDATAAPGDLIRPSVDIFMDAASADLVGRWREDTAVTSPGWSALTFVNSPVTRAEIPGVQLSQWRLDHDPVAVGTPLPFRFSVDLTRSTFPSYPYISDAGLMQLSVGRQYHVRGVTHPGCTWDSEVAGGPTDSPNLGVVGSTVQLGATRQGNTVTFGNLDLQFRTYRSELTMSQPRVILYLNFYTRSIPTSSGWTGLTYVGQTSGGYYRYDSFNTTDPATWASTAGQTTIFSAFSAEITTASTVSWAVQSGITINGEPFDLGSPSGVANI